MRTPLRGGLEMVTGVRSWVLATFFLFVSTTFAGACRQQQASDRESAGAGVSGEKVEQRGSRLTVLSRSGWVATASGSGTNTPASNAIDASATTAWRANVAQVANTQWFQVNMGGPRTFMELRMDTTGAPTEYPGQFQVNVSNDGTNWGSPVATGTGTVAVTTIAFASQTAQYVRVTLTSTPSPSVFWSIYDFNVYDASQSRTGLTATASSTASGTTTGGAFDGSATTRWSSVSGTSPKFHVHMQTSHTLTQLPLDAGSSTSGNFVRSYTASVSSDGSAFTQVAAGTGTSRFVVINFATQQARHIRINGTNTTAFTWSIEEMNVNGQPTSSVTYPRAGWAATGSPNMSGNVPFNAIDGSTTTRWTTSSAQASGLFFQVDMGTYRTFTQVTLDAGTTTNNFPRGWQLQTSNDGTTFTTVNSGTGTAALVTINVPAQTARFIKINLTTANANPWSIQELNVSGQALTTPSWVATASSNSTGNMPANAIDGSASTRWSTAGAQTNQTFTVDMGVAQVFNQLTLDAGTTPNNFPRGYSLSVSNDGTN